MDAVSQSTGLRAPSIVDPARKQVMTMRVPRLAVLCLSLECARPRRGRRRALVAVAFAASLALAALSGARPAQAAIALAGGGGVVDLGSNLATGGGVVVVTPGPEGPSFADGSAYTAIADVTGSVSATGDAAAGSAVTLTAPAGFIFQDGGQIALVGTGTVTGAAGTLSGTRASIAWTVGAGWTAGDTFTISSLEVRPLTGGTGAGPVTLTATGGGGPTTATAAGVIAVTPRAGLAAAVTPRVGTVSADGNGAVPLAVYILDANNRPLSNTAFTVVASLGCFGTECAPTAAGVTSGDTDGQAGTVVGGTSVDLVYRGNRTSGTDSLVVTVPGLAGVAPATATVNLAALVAGRIATTSVVQVVAGAVAAGVTGGASPYSSPTAGTNIVLSARDASGIGGNGQILMASVDRGALVAVASPFGAGDITTALAGCGAAASSTVVLNPTRRVVLSGRTMVVYCATAAGGAGRATVTITNLSTPDVPPVRAAVMVSGRPATVEARTAGNVISATLTDAAGNPVADGTPVRFTIAPTAGVVSVTCTTTRLGVAASTVALGGAPAPVLVSSDYSTSGPAATCEAAGGVAVGGTVATVGAPAPAAGAAAALPGVFAGAVAPSGASLVRFSGSLAQLAAASAAAGTRTAAAAVDGRMVTFVAGAPESVNAEFASAFAGGVDGPVVVSR